MRCFWNNFHLVCSKLKLESQIIKVFVSKKTKGHKGINKIANISYGSKDINRIANISYGPKDINRIANISYGFQGDESIHFNNNYII